jgi:hypothetical protein
MPKFLVGRDVAFFRNVARELVEQVVQNTCVLYKVNLNETKVNIYGESMNKTWHRGVELYCLINKEPESIAYEGFGPETSQNIEFRFDREYVREKGIYPEIGDIIYFNDGYFEIDNTNEIQFVGGLPGSDTNTEIDYDRRSWSIICTTFMVSKSNLNIEERIN